MPKTNDERGRTMETNLGGAELQEFRVVIFRECGKWVAQCLERDIATHADTVEDLPVRLALALNAEVTLSKEAGRTPFQVLPAAPKRYWAMWRGASAAQEEAQNVWSSLPAAILPKFADGPQACR